MSEWSYWKLMIGSCQKAMASQKIIRVSWIVSIKESKHQSQSYGILKNKLEWAKLFLSRNQNTSICMKNNGLNFQYMCQAQLAVFAGLKNSNWRQYFLEHIFCQSLSFSHVWIYCQLLLTDYFDWQQRSSTILYTVSLILNLSNEWVLEGQYLSFSNFNLEFLLN